MLRIRKLVIIWTALLIFRLGSGVVLRNYRNIINIIDPEYVIEGAGVLLRRSFGPRRENLFDPFLLFDHFAFNNPIEGPIRGFPTHPHRGIETVTYMLEGNVRHRDSLGNQGIISPGGVQWMTSGRGILHEEMPSRGPSGNIFGFQLWVNLPAAEKMSDPRYQEIQAQNIPVVTKHGLQVRVVAGEFQGVKGPVTEIAAQPIYMDIHLQPGAEFSISIPEEYTAVVYVFEGEGLFGRDSTGKGEYIPAVKMGVLGSGDHLQVETGPGMPVRFMLMAGAPFHEPVYPYGPFVMNTREEIQQTLREIQAGTFAQS